MGSANATAYAAARGTLLSILLRLVSFLLSQLTVRFVSASALGKASIPLELLLGTALFVGREGFRLALTKEITASEGKENIKKGGDDCRAQREGQRSQQIVNVSWLSIPTGAILSIVALAMHLLSCQRDTDQQDNDDFTSYATNSNNEMHSGYSYLNSLDYKLAGILYCVASFVESLAEPLVIRCLQEMDVTTKAKAEGAALLCKAASCFLCLYFTATSFFKTWVAVTMNLPLTREGDEGDDGHVEGEEGVNNSFAVTAFGVSQLVYALVFTMIMYQRGSLAEGGVRWPKMIQSSSFKRNAKSTSPAEVHVISQNLDLNTLNMVLIFTLQGILKHGLTEADKIVLSALAGSYDQGVYALASSYGGLAARLLLQPLEENARLLFSRQGAMIAQHMDAERDGPRNGNAIKKKEKEKEESEYSNENVSSMSNRLKDLEDTYCFLLRTVLYIGLVFATIASNYTSLLLRILAGYRWGSNAEASAALSAFCVYTAFLALNGTTEAFVYGVARSGRDVGKLGVVHAMIGGMFALIARTLVRRRGAVGLVATNCICMALRSMYSLHYARGYFTMTERTSHESLSSSGTKMISRMLPNPLVLGLFCASYAITRASRRYIYERPIAAGAGLAVPALQHIAVGVSCAVVVATSSLHFDTEIRAALRNLANRKEKAH